MRTNRSNSRAAAVAVTCCVLLTSGAWAADKPLREAQSENKEFEFKVRPGRIRNDEDRKKESRRAHGVLTHKEADKAEEKCWTAALVNEFAPVHGFVTNDGRFVVTLDEAGRGGAAHAVAIYDEHGKLKQEFGLRDLLTRADWQRVRVRRNSIDWLAGAKMKFTENNAQFEIALRSGTRIVIDLREGKLIGAGEPIADSELPDEIAAALRGESAEGDADFAAESIDLDGLVAQLADGSPLTPEELAALQAAFDNREITLDDAAKKALEQALAGLPNAYADRPAAGNSAELGVAVPAPDPAAPVDYIAWMKAQSLTPEPNASAAYQAAVDSVVPFEGDDALMDRALEGDPAAVSDPAIQAWLEQNRTAIDYIRDGDGMNYRGMPISAGDDGMMLGILLPHLSKMRQIAKTMAIDGKARELAGDIAGAQDQYIEILRLGAQNGQGPTLIENLVGIAEQGLGSQRLLDSFQNDAAGAIDYAALAEKLDESYGAMRPMSETMQFERAFVLDVIQRGYEYDAGSGSYRVKEAGLKQVSEALGMAGGNEKSEIPLGMYLGTIGFERLTDQANSYYDRMSSAAAAPFLEGRQQFGVLEGEVSDPGFKVSNPLLSALLPALSRAREMQVRADTNRNATLLITNLKAYRQQRGSYPESLDTLGGHPFINDPFSGNRYVYRRQGDDFTLYSTGPNGTDEGGVHDPKYTTNDVLYWPRPPKQ